MRRTLIGSTTLALFTLTAGAIEPLPTNSGWHGFVSPAVSAVEVRDNQIAGAGPLEIGNERIESLDEKPDKESAGSFSMNAEVGYMFADRDTYLYLGNRLEDVLRLDNSSELGLRTKIDGLGILEAGLMFSAVATEVWTDPFLTGADREETDRSSQGVRVGLANLFDSPFEVHLSVRQVEVDDERSGESLTLTPAERDLLARDGDSARLEVLYTWVINKQHVLIPSVNFGTYDADGDAITRSGGGAKITHAFSHGRYRLVSNLSITRTSFDEENPVFDEKADADEFLISVTGFYSRFFDIDNLSGMASLLYAESDSDIDFYYSEATLVSLGVLYRF